GLSFKYAPPERASEAAGDARGSVVDQPGAGLRAARITRLIGLDRFDEAPGLQSHNRLSWGQAGIHEHLHGGESLDYHSAGSAIERFACLCACLPVECPPR